MRISYSLGSLLTIDDIQRCAKILGKVKHDVLWIPETWGMENFAMLSAVSYSTNSKIGSSIINIYSRSPAVISMGAVTVDTISNGRLILGLGASSRPIVEDFHGYEFSKPLARMREYIKIVKILTAGKRIDYNGEFFKLKGFSLLTKPVRDKIPIYIAAVNKNMIQTASEMADGVIFYLRPISEMKQTISKMQSQIDVTCQIITAVSHDAEKAIRRAKLTIAFYIYAGSTYREFLANNGFASEVNTIYDEFKRSGLESAAQLVPDRLADSLAIFGTPEESKKRLQRFQDAGVDLPIIQFNPVGDITESFKLLTSTFSGDDSC